jgi:predicted cupin superfamily sugar epimerase
MGPCRNLGWMNERARQLIVDLKLTPHPEGGFYRETFRSDLQLPEAALPRGYGGQRAAVTAILFLLPTGARSALHRVRSDEIWMHHQGDPVRLEVEGIGEVLLGQQREQLFQATVPGGRWQAAECLEGPTGYALVGCVVAPGFDFLDFELQ